MASSNRYGMAWCGVMVGLWLFGNLQPVFAQDTDWEALMTVAGQALAQRQYDRAIRQFQAALTLAESYPDTDPRMLSSLTNLATAYQAQGQYQHAAALYQRALSLQEQLYSAEDPQILEVLDAVIAMQRQMHPVQSLFPWSVVNRLANRAQRIRDREERARGEEFPEGAWLDESQIFGGGEP